MLPANSPVVLSAGGTSAVLTRRILALSLRLRRQPTGDECNGYD